MSTVESIGLYLASAIYIFAGIMHFINERFYLKAMPPYIPYHKAMVQLSGMAEIVLGAGLLLPATRTYAAWGIIVLLIAVFPANVYMATSGKFHRMPQLLLWLRLPLQFLLLGWAYLYT